MKGGAAMTQQEIIEIVQSMDHQSAFRSYYQFAHTYLLHMQISGSTDTEAFWNVIRHCQKTSGSKNTIQAMGKAGSGSPADIRSFCGSLLNNPHLSAAGTDDLCSIFGYCAHLGK